jgi:quercetin dioxygenase-like cupin family protein
VKEAERFDVTGRQGGTHYQQALVEANLREVAKAGLQSLVAAEDMIWEDSPQGRLKHVVNDKMGVRECALDIYLQVIEAGQRSGRHHHFSEEIIYVLEGEGYELHWDPQFDLGERYQWRWAEEPKRFDWTADDFVYIPPYVTHQHVAGPDSRVRLISATARVVKALGFDGLEQVEAAPGRA